MVRTFNASSKTSRANADGGNTDKYRVVVKSVGYLPALKIDENIEAKKKIWYQKVRWNFKFFIRACFQLLRRDY